MWRRLPAPTPDLPSFTVAERSTSTPSSKKKGNGQKKGKGKEKEKEMARQTLVQQAQVQSSSGLTEVVDPIAAWEEAPLVQAGIAMIAKTLLGNDPWLRLVHGRVCSEAQQESLCSDVYALMCMRMMLLLQAFSCTSPAEVAQAAASSF
jgi:hypothetical protein